ncbi:hypothetical protein CDL15_Pgr027442 [Punica granatum]|uniref:Membrane-associated kinase regulator 6 n=1 Tax=Punica granatum TaxID=22663 RepID=A0A218XHF8_PUNGR|nr:hypothetical protein CDL15_Pgr027442 [Punica granatum]
MLISHPTVPSSTLLDSDIDFEFSVCESSDFEPSSAEELFCNGEIQAIGVRRRMQNFPAKLQINDKSVILPSRPPMLPVPQARAVTGPTLAKLVEIEQPDDDMPHCHSLWRLVRSCSSSSASSNKSSGLCFIPFMPRSYSTAFKSSTSKTSNLSEKNNCRKQSSISPSKKKKSLGSINGRNYGRISPALNVPPPDVFGFGSLCLSKKCKNQA